jgi:hypothetical protein
LAVQPVAALPPRVVRVTNRLSFLVFALEAHQARRVVVQDLWLAFLDLSTDIPYLGCLITLELKSDLPGILRNNAPKIYTNPTFTTSELLRLPRAIG